MIIVKSTDFNADKYMMDSDEGYDSIRQSVSDIIDLVKKDQDSAVIELTNKFDHCNIDSLVIDAEEIDKAYNSIDTVLRDSLENAVKNIEIFHKTQIRQSTFITGIDGTMLGQKITPLDIVGIYVPGGTARYPSTVLMNAIPAKIAGVGKVVVTTPPDSNGEIDQAVLAACKIAGVDKVIRCGGAQAIAALAYGTQSVPRVDKIVGPGNAYVALAKQMVFGRVAIDMIAGPSELLVIADESATPKYIASDLLGQSEHDTLARAILVTDSAKLADEVSAEVDKQLKELKRNEIAAASIATMGRIIIAESIDEAVDISNQIAPEHLEVFTKEPMALLGKIKHAGSVFIGEYSPEALGDYMAGPNHTLPTSGTARFSSPLSLDDFIKKTQVTYYTKEALAKVKDGIIAIANQEKLSGHARSVEIRFED